MAGITIRDNVEQMADMVVNIKRRTKLSENTILRLLDTAFALSQPTAQGMPPFAVEPDQDPDGETPVRLIPDTEEQES